MKATVVSLMLLCAVALLLVPGFFLVALRQPTWAIRWRIVSYGNSAWNQGERIEEAYRVTKWAARREARRMNDGETGSGIWRAEIERRR